MGFSPDDCSWLVSRKLRGQAAHGNWAREMAVLLSCPGRGAAFFMPLRRAGTPVKQAGPRTQRTASQMLRAALRPGHGDIHSAFSVRTTLTGNKSLPLFLGLPKLNFRCAILISGSSMNR